MEGEWPAGEKIKLGVREINEKRERKKEENYSKKRGKGLKNASKIFAPPPCISKKEVGKKIIKMHNIYPCIFPKHVLKSQSLVY